MPVPAAAIEITTQNVMALLRSDRVAEQEAAYGWLCAQLRRITPRLPPGEELDDLAIGFIERLLADEQRAALVAVYNVGGLHTMMRRYLGEQRRERSVEARWRHALQRKIKHVLASHPMMIKVRGDRWALRDAATPREALEPLPARLVITSESRLPAIADNIVLNSYLIHVMEYMLHDNKSTATAAEIGEICWQKLSPRPMFLEYMGDGEVSEALSGAQRYEIEEQASGTLARIDREEARVVLARVSGRTQREHAAERGVTTYAVESRWNALREAIEAAGIIPGQWADEPVARKYYEALIMAGLERLIAEET
jgi:hypothetical protein